MKTYDWIVIGGGITGSALSYELAKQSFRVLLLEKDAKFQNATRYSYGGLAYWSGTTELTRQLCQEGIAIHRQLTEELEADTEFREIDLLLTINRGENPALIAKNYEQFAIPPRLLNVSEACEVEPLLNPEAIAGALQLPHGHIHPQKTNQAYQQAFCRLGGEIKFEPVVELLRQGNQFQGVATAIGNHYAGKTVICGGGLSRALLQEAGITISLYFTHAQLLAIPPTDIRLQTLIMPAVQQRFALEAEASQPAKESLWNSASPDMIAKILDPGAVQFQDGSLYLGQISAIGTNPHLTGDLAGGEGQIRQEIATILPSLANLAGVCHHCLVAFTNSALPLAGKIENLAGIYLFSGFTSTLVFAPPLARHFANWAAGRKGGLIGFD